MTIVKSPNDDRNYRHIILPNKLEAVLISDPKTKIGAASLTVNVGHYNDPDDYLGLAHFLEHMLFMGTKKYQDENHYGKFLNDHGGSSNAFTAEEITTYFFNIDVEFLDQALDIFGQFFISPLLKEGSIDREINAVDSEHSKNYNSDVWRFNRILKIMSRQEHPFSKFSTGNLETLKKPGIRDALINFYDKYYSANIMKLSVISNKNLDDIEELVRKIFKNVKNKNIKLMNYDKQPFDLSKSNKNSECLKLAKMIPIAEEHTLHIYYQLSNTNIYYKSKPLYYLINLICHKSEGSIYYNLKEKGLINNIFCTLDEDISTTMLEIYVNLTDKGFKYIPTILNTINEYIDLIKKEGVQEWFYNELKTIADLNFKYLDKMKPIDYVVDISCDMVFYSIKDLLTNRYLVEKFSKKTQNLIKKITSNLKKENSIIVIGSKYYKDIVTNKEKYYGIKYKVKDIPKKLGDEFLNLKLKTKLHLPEKNIFIPKSSFLGCKSPKGDCDLPKNTSLLKGEGTKYPTKLKTNFKLLEAWYKKDDKFKKPQIILGAKIITGEITKNIKNYIISIIYSLLVEHKIKSFVYYAHLADSYLKLFISGDSLNINIQCYRDNIKVILKKLFDSIFDLRVDKNSFDIVKKIYKKNLKNFIYNPPYSLGIEYLKEKTFRNYYTFDEQLKIIDEIYLEEIKIVEKWFKNNMIKCLIQGDVNKDLCEEITDYFRELYNKDIKKVVELNDVVPIDPGDEIIYIKKLYNNKELDSLINLFYEIDEINIGSTKNWDNQIVNLLMVHKLTKESFFDKLRSQEQSGYIVKSKILMLGPLKNSLKGLSFFIQSNKKTPDYLYNRIMNFINEMYKKISNFSNETFKKYVNSAINSLLKDDYTLEEEFERNFKSIIEEHYIFNYKEKYIKILKDLKLEDVIEFYEKYFINDNTRKLRTIKLYSFKHYNEQF